MFASFRVSRTAREWLACGGLVLSLATVISGCSQATPVDSDPVEAKAAGENETPPPRTGEDVLERMAAAYQQAQSYEDVGKLRVRYKQGGDIASETIDFSAALVRPNKLRMQCYGAAVVCDGRDFRATIDDRPGEVLSVAAPAKLSLEAIYADPYLQQALNLMVGSVPAVLFLESSPLAQIVGKAETPRLAEPEKIDGQACYRVEIERPDGRFVFWIDERTYVLRRAEFPTEGFRQLLEQNLGTVSEVTLVADFKGARLNAAIDDDAFRFEAPNDAELVEQFGAQLGARIHKFAFPTLDGDCVTRESLAGKIAVINFWRTDDTEYSFKDLPNLEKVYRRYQDREGLVFLAVNVDPEETKDDDLRSAFDKADLSLPIGRDPNHDAYRAFMLQGVPTTVILGADGKLQDHVLGYDPDQATALAKKLDKLLGGGDLTAEATQPSQDALSIAELAPKSEPQRLRLKRLWECRELKSPGNILVATEADSDDQVFVLEGVQSVVQIDHEGRLTATRPLDLPQRDDAVITFLRTATDAAGKRYFVGSASSVRQLHLFDAGWKRLLSYPQTGEHPGIADALLADLDGDGAPEIAVGYWGALGVHCVTLDGHGLWQNQVVNDILRLAVAGPDGNAGRRLLAASLKGTLLPIDGRGKDRAPIALAGRFVRLIFTADLDGDERPEWCAIAQDKLESGQLGPDVAVGISSAGEELWSYPLPAGSHAHAAFEMVAAGNLLGGEAGEWVIAGADGSIHVLAIDGAAIDRFNYGASPSGLAVARLDGRPALLVATDEGVEAWRVEAGEEP